MPDRHYTFIAVPSDVSDPVVLKRFLDVLIEKIDIAFSKRGEEGFANSTELVSTATSLEELRDDVNSASILYLKKDSSNLEELHYTTIPTLNDNTLIHKAYVDSKYLPQQSPDLAVAEDGIDELKLKYNSLVDKLVLSGILL